MEVYLGKIYTPIVFSDVAPSVPFFYRVKGLVKILCALYRPHFLMDFFQFFFFTDVHYSQIYRPIVFGDAAPGVPSFIGSKVIFW